MRLFFVIASISGASTLHQHRLVPAAHLRRPQLARVSRRCTACVLETSESSLEEAVELDDEDSEETSVSTFFDISDDACILPEPALEAALDEEGNGGNGDEDSSSDAGFAASLVDIPTDQVLFIAPIVIPIVASLFFKQEVELMHEFLEWCAQARWVQVDGGLSRTAALLPVLTGIVLPAVSFALGTLTATTISTLRARQVQLRVELNTEACLIRSVLSAIESLFPAEYYSAERSKAALLLRQYCSRVLVESRAGINLEQLARQGAANSELDGLTFLLHHAKRFTPPPVAPAGQPAGGGDANGASAPPNDASAYPGPHAAHMPPVSGMPPIPRFEASTEFLAQMYLEKLQLSRSERLAVLQTTFPAVHWLALTLLGISIVLGFLLAADQQTLLFLAPVQLRLLFAVLVGSLVATACICIDLANPFSGAFQITPSSEQLFLIRDLVDQTLIDNEAEEPVPVPAPVRPPMRPPNLQTSLPRMSPRAQPLNRR